MKKLTTTRKHILSKRAKLIKFLKVEGYSGEDIAQIFNMDRSSIARALIMEEHYKKKVKRMLSD